MWQMKKGPTRFRCHVGHAYASENLLEDHSRTREATLWSAARLLREQAALIQTQIDTGTRSPAVVERAWQF
jgi:two-component system chemotaxis response regulator CheB